MLAMNTLIALIILVADIVAIVDCIKSNKDTGKKILWVAIILLVPLVGMLLYFVVGKKQ